MSVTGFVVSRSTLLVLLVTMGFLGACTIPISSQERRDRADAIAGAAGFEKSRVSANGFVLTAYWRSRTPGVPVTVYIEGDGYAWKSRRRLSGDPTPTNPVALRLAVQDPSDNVVYLARPCQYLLPDERLHCAADYWSTKRFAEEVVVAANEAIERFRIQTQARGVYLIGYSGGGAVAALVAARRSDVLGLRTVAGILDHAAFTAWHDVTPLHGSLNPADRVADLAQIPQHHFGGADDQIVPPFIAKQFIQRLGNSHCARHTTMVGISHDLGWVESWPGLLTLPLDCTAP